MKDIVYIYDKINFTRNELGEIQKNFNLSFVIDGTKDSAKVVVQNFSDAEVEPLSIIKHKATNTWWVVSHDRVIRYQNDVNYYYEHELELLGAIELLNARDLTDSGFNQNRYTIGEVIARLLKHSSFEFKSNYNLYSQDNIDLDKNVDYVKTFENYTLLSALREFIDGYNCSIKMTFSEDSVTGALNGANFYIISKTGNVNSNIYNDSDFNKVEQVKTMDKNSFGTSVVSNAENVISTKTKTYPSMGSVKVTGTNETITNKTAVVRLPSNAFRVNWIELIDYKTSVQIFSYNLQSYTIISSYEYNPDNNSSMNIVYNNIKNDLPSSLIEDFTSSFPIEKLSQFGRRRFYYTDKYDPINYSFTSEYPINIRYTWDGHERQTVLSNSELKNNTKYPDNVIYFERGSNLIKGFDFFNEPDAPNNKNEARFIHRDMNGIVFTGVYNNTNYVVVIGSYSIEGPSLEDVTPTMEYYNLSTMGVIVNYVPMSDIKIKVDNTLDKRDSNYYNQNGKLTDSVALSKMILSHSKEIESDTITKNALYYYKNSNGVIESNIPNVGDLVNINSDLYVINNVSLTYYQNEVDNLGTDINYMVSCEFTMSKNVAVKSMLTTPNTNIRDYGIPQTNNVARKQLYRDFYELNYTQDGDSETPYLTLDKVLNISNEYQPYQEHTAVIKLSFNGDYGTDPKSTWYYQLDSTTFIMKKMIYEVINFNDNNIIGYSNQNVWSGFDIKRIIGGMIDLANTPISYVDENGEFESIEIALCTNQQLTTIYQTYITASGSENTTYGAFYSCFIPSQIYEGGNVENEDTSSPNYGTTTTITGAKDSNDFMINEIDYHKDALEVPVFEYSCQLDDSEKVIIGSNVFDNYEIDNAYLYSFVFVEKGKYNDNNFSLNNLLKLNISSNNIATITSTNNANNGAVKMSWVDGKIYIELFTSCSMNLTTREVTYSTPKIAFDTTKDLIIVRHRVLEQDLYRDVIGELISNTVYVTLPTTDMANYFGKYAVKTDDNYYHCEVDTETTVGSLLNQNTNYYWNNSEDNNVPTTNSSNRNKSVAVLTLTPPSPSDDKIISSLNTTNYYVYTNFSGYDNMPTPILNHLVGAKSRYISSNVTLATTEVPELILGQEDPSDAGISGGSGLHCVSKVYKPRQSYTFNGIQYNVVLAVQIRFTSTSQAKTFMETDPNIANIDCYGYCVGVLEYQTQVRFYRLTGHNPYTLNDISTFALDNYWYQLRNSNEIYELNNDDLTFELYTGRAYIEWRWLGGAWDDNGNQPDANYVYKLMGVNEFYYWNGSGFTQYTNPSSLSYIESGPSLFMSDGNGWSSHTDTTNYHYFGGDNKYYRWTGSSWSQGTSIQEWHWFTGLVNTQPFVDSGVIDPNDFYEYLDRYYKWNGSQWVDSSNYQWVEIGNANDQYFTYDNNLLKYNATTNQFLQESSTNIIDKTDLMFICKDLPIVDNGLSLFINYFKTY